MVTNELSQERYVVVERQNIRSNFVEMIENNSVDVKTYKQIKPNDLCEHKRNQNKLCLDPMRKEDMQEEY